MRGVNSQLSFILNLLFKWQSIAQSRVLNNNFGGFAMLFLHKSKEELLYITGFKRPIQPRSVWLYHYIINYFLRSLECFRGFDFAIDCVIENQRLFAIQVR